MLPARDRLGHFSRQLCDEPRVLPELNHLDAFAAVGTEAAPSRP
jgi:hypothetical protein